MLSLEPDCLFGIIQQNSQSICLPSPSDYAATGSCKQYFANVGKANLDLLQRESSERQQLLLEALTCLVCGQGTTLLKAGERLVIQLSEGGKMLLCSGIQFYLISLSCVTSENPRHTSKQGKCKDSGSSGL